MKYDEVFKEKIANLNLFEEVILISEKKIKNKVAALNDKKLEKLTKKQREESFDKVIFAHYKGFLCEKATYHFFNQTSMIYYYVVRNRLTAHVLEDGYKSLATQDDYAAFVSVLAKMNKFVNNGYIPLAIDPNVVDKVIGSNTQEEIKGKAFKDKYTQQDFALMLRNEKKDIVDKLFHIFDYQNLDVPKNSALILTQPLAAFRYCYADEQYLVYKKMVNEALAKADMVHIKPHPSDRLIYRGLSNERVKIIEGKFPIELLMFNENNYDYIYSFDSTVIQALVANKEKIKIYSREQSEKTFMASIKAYIEDEKVIVGVNASVSEGKMTKLNKGQKYLYQKITGNSYQETYNHARKQKCDYVYYNDKEATVSIGKLFKAFEKAMQTKCREIFSVGITYTIENEKFNNNALANRHYYEYFFNKVVGIKVLEHYVSEGNNWSKIIRENYENSPNNQIRVEVDLQEKLKDFIDKDEYSMYLLAKEEKEKLKKIVGSSIEKEYLASIDKHFIELINLLNMRDSTSELDVIKYFNFLDNEARESLLRNVLELSLKPKRIRVKKEIRKELDKVGIGSVGDTKKVVKKMTVKQKLKNIIRK